MREGQEKVSMSPAGSLSPGFFSMAQAFAGTSACRKLRVPTTFLPSNLLPSFLLETLCCEPFGYPCRPVLAVGVFNLSQAESWVRSWSWDPTSQSPFRNPDDVIRSQSEFSSASHRGTWALGSSGSMPH